MSLSIRPQRVFAHYTEITPKFLQKRGIELLLCDLDYTLAPKYVPRPDEELHRWLEDMETGGIRVIILSNNRNPQRVERFCGDLGIDYVGRAQKPYKHGYIDAMKKTGAEAARTAMLGDKLLTDVLGANRCGIQAFMVEPNGGPHGAWNHVLHALQRPFKALAREKRRDHESF